MIVSPVTSQVKYIVNSDTLICYTKQENRNIAILFAKGDKYKNLHSIDSLILKEQNTLIDDYKLKVSLNDIKIGYLTDENRTLYNKVGKLSNENKSLNSAKLFWQGGTVLMTLLFVVAIIK